MKRILLLAVILLCSSRMWANTCAANATGNWATVGTWTSCGGVSPGFGDTATIGGSFVVTVAASTTANVGTDGATGTAAVTVSSTAQLIINGTLDTRGDLIQTAEGTTVTINGGGTLILDSLAGKQYAWGANNTGATKANRVIAGTAWTAGNFGTVNGSGGRGGTNGTMYGNLYSFPTFNYALFKNMGDSSNHAYDHFQQLATEIDFQHNVIWLTSGRVHIDIESGGINWNAVDFRSPTAGIPAEVVNDAPPSTATRSMTNLTFYNASGTEQTFEPNFSGVTISNWIAYNTQFFTSGNLTTNVIVDRLWSMLDTASGSDLFSPAANAGITLQNSIFLTDADNPHFITEQSPNSPVIGPNVVWGCIFDGNGHTANDAGDLVLPFGSVTFKKNIAINDAGTLFTMLNTGAGNIMTALNNTSYNSDGGTVGETNGVATQMLYALNNLFSSSESRHPDGYHQGAAFVSQSGWTMDYTGYFNMTGASNITHPILGNKSYLGVASVNPWFTSGAFGDNGKGLHDITGDPQFVDNTRTVRGYGSWASVIAAAKEMVTINGIDFNGAATTATTKSVNGALSYIRTGFTPTNPIYLGTGYDGTDIGATGGFSERTGGH